MTGKRTLVIMAAGMGSRFGGLKQLAPMGPNGETLLEYSIYDALRAGFCKIVLVARRQTESLFRARFDGSLARRVELDYVFQELDDLPPGCAPDPRRSKPWGTGHALLCAEKAVDGPFAILNADDYYGPDAFEVLGRARGACVVGFEVGDTLSPSGAVSRALCRTDSSGFLTHIEELPKIRRDAAAIVYEGGSTGEAGGRLVGDEIVSMNLWGFEASVFELFRARFRAFLSETTWGATPEREFLLPDEVGALVRQGVLQVEVKKGSGPWCGVTYADDGGHAKSVLGAQVDAGRYPSPLWSA